MTEIGGDAGDTQKAGPADDVEWEGDERTVTGMESWAGMTRRETDGPARGVC